MKRLEEMSRGELVEECKRRGIPSWRAGRPYLIDKLREARSAEYKRERPVVANGVAK
jgi:hypothetical protein